MEKISYNSFLEWENELTKTDMLLDIGCWSGENTIKFNKKCDAFGIEIDESKLALASDDIKPKIKIGDITKEISFSNQFDWIYMGEVLEHVINDELAIKNISTALKQGGHLIITTPHKIRLFEVWDPAWIKWKFGGPVHRHYSIQELDLLLSKYGIQIEKYAIGYGIEFIFLRWANILLKHVFKAKPIEHKYGDGYFDLCVIARKLK